MAQRIGHHHGLHADHGEAAVEVAEVHQPDRGQIILVPLNHAALRHGGVFDRHQAPQRTLRNDETADVLRQMTRKTDD